jgi:hypothetical protein
MVFKKGKLIKEYNGNRTSEDMFKFFKPYLVMVNNKTNKKLHKSLKRKKTRRR